MKLCWVVWSIIWPGFAYLAKCPFARYRFKNELIDGVRIRSSRMVQRFVELHGIGGEVTRMIGTVMPTGMLP